MIKVAAQHCKLGLWVANEARRVEQVLREPGLIYGVLT